nr:F-box protein CPR1-like [Quercus suber]POE95460.1 f-box protein cpr30 [Quercus suber]
MRYNLKSDSWKEIDFPMEERALISFNYDLVAINTNGAFHRLTWLPNNVSILIFNRFSEKLMLFDIPIKPSKEQRRGTYLQVLNGKLCFSLNTGYSVDIWGFMEYGKSNSWHKIYGLNFAKINPQPLAIYRPLLVSEDDRQLLLEESIGLKTKLLWYKQRVQGGLGLKVYPKDLSQLLVLGPYFCWMK